MPAVQPLVSLAACSARGSPHPSSTSHATAVASANADASAKASCYASGGTWVATGNGSCIPNPTQAASSDSSDSSDSATAAQPSIRVPRSLTRLDGKTGRWT